LSPMEDYANRFLDWYLAAMSDEASRAEKFRSGVSHG